MEMRGNSGPRNGAITNGAMEGRRRTVPAASPKWHLETRPLARGVGGAAAWGISQARGGYPRRVAPGPPAARSPSLWSAPEPSPGLRRAGRPPGVGRERPLWISSAQLSLTVAIFLQCPDWHLKRTRNTHLPSYLHLSRDRRSCRPPP